MEVPRSSYYYWKKQSQSVDVERESKRQLVKKIHADVEMAYGSRRMSTELSNRGVSVGRHQARSLMREAQVEAVMPKPKHKYPQTEIESAVAPNLLKREFSVDTPNTVWTGDITYIRTLQGWLYLAIVLDLYSRRVVGWAVSETPDTALTKRALTVALGHRERGEGLLFHSDQGCQYTSKAFQTYLIENNIKQSMSRRGNCWDNAPTERFFCSLKAERIRNKIYSSSSLATSDTLDYIHRFYNHARIHSACGNMPPAIFEKLNQAA